MHKLYGCNRDFYNPNDKSIHQLSEFKLAKVSDCPPKVDLRNYCSPVFNQYTLGSCTGNALVGALEFLENKQNEFENNNKFVNLSRLFVYYNERLLENTVNKDAGAQLSDGIKVLTNTGACLEEKWPYDIHNWNKEPPVTAFEDAETRRISASGRVGQTMTDIRKTLAGGYPIVFGFVVYESFESDEVKRTGELNMPKPFENPLGGHAVMMVGYDDEAKRVIVRNSWGSDWGQNGYFTMPYDYVTNGNLTFDLWSITK